MPSASTINWWKRQLSVSDWDDSNICNLWRPAWHAFNEQTSEGQYKPRASAFILALPLSLTTNCISTIASSNDSPLKSARWNRKRFHHGMKGFQLQENERPLIMCSENVSTSWGARHKKFIIQKVQLRRKEITVPPKYKGMANFIVHLPWATWQFNGMLSSFLFWQNFPLLANVFFGETQWNKIWSPLHLAILQMHFTVNLRSSLFIITSHENWKSTGDWVARHFQKGKKSSQKT